VESVIFKSVIHLGLAGTEDHNLGSETVVRDISGLVEVVATITDADDDVVSKVLKYSTDEGNTWNEIAADGDGKYFVDFSTLGGGTPLFSVSATDSTGFEDMLEDSVEVDLNDGFHIENEGSFFRGTYTRTEWSTSKIFRLPTYFELDPDEGDSITIHIRKDEVLLEEVTPGSTYTSPSDLPVGTHVYDVTGVEEYGAEVEKSDPAIVHVYPYDDDDDGGGG
jgi:hypothetical protein